MTPIAHGSGAASAVTSFPTAVGECAIAWNDVGLAGVWLPATQPGGLARSIARRLPDAREATPPEDVAAVIASIRRLLDGEAIDLRAVRLDLHGIVEVARRVYAATREIPPGRVVTYGAIDRALGGDVGARAVGQALGANPFAIVVPCHRVVAADGRLGGFSAPGGTALKQRLLAIERARPDGPPGLFDADDAGVPTDVADPLRSPGAAPSSAPRRPRPAR